ncbi:carboxylesterase family protein [Agarivorans sp.]|uniref:carboxylesterase family protein n=1 Tax=Agarivorans sp. TaxID=1872412 RepID=UPI003CFF084E
MKWKLHSLAILLGLVLTACSDNDSSLEFTPDPPPEVPGEETIEFRAGGVDVLALKQEIAVTALDDLNTSRAIEVIKGIPYAYAERFEHSQLLPMTSLAALNQPVDATKFGDVCPQLETELPNSEACLNLNIWRPAGTSASDNLPVYVYIHGGSFEAGSGQAADIIPDVVVAQSILDTNRGERSSPFIAVTFNYRLGLLGSLWVDDNGDTKGGNFGIGDQKRALQWVNQYIKFFGGNPENVTVFGQGAGATSISVLQQTPDPALDTLGVDNVAGVYFHKAIMQSLPFGLPFRSYELAENSSVSVEDAITELFPDRELAQLTIAELLEVQSKVKSEFTGRLFGLPDGLIEELVSDVLDGLDAGDDLAVIGARLALKYGADIASIEPRAKMLAFAPYLESHRECIREGILGCREYADYLGYHVSEQAIDSDLKVPAVVGFNSDDSNSYTAAFKIPFVINLEIAGVNLLDIIMSLLDSAVLPAGIDNFIPYSDQSVNIPVYAILSSIIHLDHISALALQDFAPVDDDTNLAGVTENMSKFNALNNQLLFKCAARDYVQRNAANGLATLYHFDYKASFNTNVLDDSFFGTLGNLSCFGGKPCNKAEVPFIFNRLYNERGTEIVPKQKDKDLMKTVSRLWFSEALFQNYNYSQTTDNVLMVRNVTVNGEEQGEVVSVDDWESIVNVGEDPEAMAGICEAIY